MKKIGEGNRNFLSDFSVLFICIFLMMFSNNSRAQGIIADGADPVKLAEGFSFTEGPSADAQGNIYFTDQPNNKIWIWTVDGELELFTENAGRSNGLYFTEDDKLVACADENNELWLFDMQGNHEVLVDGYHGEKLNGPNDAWIDNNGGIYFTDPLYQRDYWAREGMFQDGEHVYYLTPDRSQLIRVTTEVSKPNGIIGTPDNNLLYISDMGERKIYVFTVNEDGTLSNRKLFAEMGSDGMTMDEKGNVYLTGRGVTVFNWEGEKIVEIPIDERWTANVCFGGPDNNTLFITASEGIYSLEMTVKGAN